MSDRLSDLDPFTVHDPGCHCWPHVSESALSEAVIAGAVDEYRASKAAIATLRAALDGLVEAATDASDNAEIHFHERPSTPMWWVDDRRLHALRAALATAKEAT